MTLILIFVGIGALLGLTTGRYPGADWIPGAISGALFGFFTALIIGAIIYTGTTWKTTEDKPLVSLADGSDTHGQFFLGSGTVDSSPSFTWYESDGANSYVRKDVDASEATVHYTTGTPHYTVRKEKTKYKGFIQQWGLNTSGGYGEHYDFYVPKGSIMQSYKLDNH